MARITIAFRGVTRTPSELASLLADEISYWEQVLTARQREVIKDHLINDVASHLQQLISDAEAQVAQLELRLVLRTTRLPSFDERDFRAVAPLGGGHFTLPPLDEDHR